ncbi:Uma2 family endonuclease [Runella sp. MFBS21]|uniref:Uma2 family endonuclease n=1 Tax=Runella sp. MFBS21 TaxID=3034018 RepID=UPI0023F7214C|nr:Uma2 family endonuclease [Runella sp. MFBS21]MDF7816523.1 Uma2 family endonuclease [Runella sp. MFBS21]
MITNINALDLNGTYSYADYLKWRFEEQVELIKGKIYLMSPAPKTAHQWVSGQLSYLIRKYLENSPCSIFEAPFDVRLPIGNEKNPAKIYTVVQPDICVICDETKLDEDGCLGPPDLIVEITSRSTFKKDFNDKFNWYEKAGVREYWIAIPSEKTIQVYYLHEEQYQLGGIYDQSPAQSVIFEGFEAPLEKIFR